MRCKVCGAYREDDERLCPVCGAGGGPSASGETGGRRPPGPSGRVPHEGTRPGGAAPHFGGAAYATASAGPSMPGWNCSPSANVGAPAKGCLAQAVSDITGSPDGVRRILRTAGVPAAVAAVSMLAPVVPVAGMLVSPIGLVAAAGVLLCCCGYGIAWGRELSAPHGFDGTVSVLRTSLLSLGFFGAALGAIALAVSAIPALVAWALSIFSIGWGFSVAAASDGAGMWVVGTAITLITGVLSLVLHVLSVALGIALGMVTDAMALHLVVSGRLESAFAVHNVWAAIRRQPGKLLCASIIPGLVAAVSCVAAYLVLSLLFDLLAGLSSDVFGPAALFMPSAVDDLFDSGLAPKLFWALVAGVASFAVACAQIVRYRAVGYWASRYAAEWAGEGEVDAVLPLPEGLLAKLNI